MTNSLVVNDVLAAHSGYQQYRERLLNQGFKLYEMRARMDSNSSFFGSSGACLHTKVFLLDDQIGFIGSFNMDSRSINLNTEMDMSFNHPGIAADLRQEYEKLITGAVSYQGRLNSNGQLEWIDQQGEQTRTLSQEPESANQCTFVIAN